MLRASSVTLALASLFSSAVALAQTPPPDPPPSGDKADGAPAKPVRPPVRPDIQKPGPKVGADIPPELAPAVYRERRRALLDRLGACAALVPSQFARVGTTGDAFFYLTGSREPNAALLLSPRQVARTTVIVAARGVNGGARDVHARALMRTDLAVDEVAIGGADGDRAVARALRKSRCYAALQPSLDTNPALSRGRLRELLRAVDGHVQQKWQVFERMRASKGEAEIARIDKAAALAIHGHRAALGQVQSNLSERDLATTIDRAVQASGGQASVQSRVVSGQRAAQLDAKAGDNAVGKGQLVVYDGRASFGGYAARAVRTYPASGSFSPEQAAVYDAVLAAHEKAIASIRSGVSLARVRKIARSALEGAGYRAQRNGSRGTPHADGHFIGLAMRDVGDLDGPLDAGMVVVVETGVLMPGQGAVRMADMVLVEPRSRRLITANLPRSRAGVTAWMRKARGNKKFSQTSK